MTARERNATLKIDRTVVRSLALFERMSEKKNGTPTSAVMMPIGKTTPGMIDYETIEVSDSSNAPERIEPGRKKR